MNFWTELPVATKAKYIAITIVSLLFIVFIFQNLEHVQLDVLFWSFNVRFVFALILCFIMGGALTYLLMRLKKKSTKDDELSE